MLARSGDLGRATGSSPRSRACCSPRRSRSAALARRSRSCSAGVVADPDAARRTAAVVSTDSGYVIPVLPARLLRRRLARCTSGRRRDATAAALVFMCLVSAERWRRAGRRRRQTARRLLRRDHAVAPGWLVGRLVRARRAAAPPRFASWPRGPPPRSRPRDGRGDRDERARIGQRASGHHRPQRQRDGRSRPGARGWLLRAASPNGPVTSILNVEQTGREALADLRRLLGMLRKDDDPRALSPAARARVSSRR